MILILAIYEYHKHQYKDVIIVRYGYHLQKNGNGHTLCIAIRQ